MNWHGGLCHAPPRPQRGTSPSPREVFDRATFSHSAIDHRLQFGTFRRWRAGIEVDWRAHFRTNDELRRRKDEMGGRRSAVWRQAESPEGDGYEREGEDDQGGHLQ